MPICARKVGARVFRCKFEFSVFLVICLGFEIIFSFVVYQFELQLNIIPRRSIIFQEAFIRFAVVCFRQKFNLTCDVFCSFAFNMRLG